MDVELTSDAQWLNFNSVVVQLLLQFKDLDLGNHRETLRACHQTSPLLSHSCHASFPAALLAATLVFRQQLLAGELFRTRAATEGFLASVRPRVGRQNGPPRECFATNGARKHFRPCVLSHVITQCRTITEV